MLAIKSIDENPKSSSRKRAAERDVSKNLLQKIHTDHQIRPHKPKFIHTFNHKYYALGLEFCNVLGEMLWAIVFSVTNFFFQMKATLPQMEVLSQNCRRNLKFRINTKN